MRTHVTETKEMVKTEEAEEIVESEQEKTAIRRYIRPEYRLCINDDGTGYEGTFVIPGVEKETIDLKINEGFIRVSGEYENVRYGGTYFFEYRVDPKTAVSHYKEGLLKFTVDFKKPELSPVEVKFD